MECGSLHEVEVVYHWLFGLIESFKRLKLLKWLELIANTPSLQPRIGENGQLVTNEPVKFEK